MSEMNIASTKMNEVPSALERLDTVIEDLLSLPEIFEAQFAPVLSPVKDSETEKSVPDARYESALANEIMERARRVRLAGVRLHAILQRNQL